MGSNASGGLLLLARLFVLSHHVMVAVLRWDSTVHRGKLDVVPDGRQYVGGSDGTEHGLGRMVSQGMVSRGEIPAGAHRVHVHGSGLAIAGGLGVLLNEFTTI